VALQHLASPHVSYLDAGIAAVLGLGLRREQLAVRADRRPPDGIREVEGSRNGACPHVPEGHPSIDAAGDQRLAIGGEREGIGGGAVLGRQGIDRAQGSEVDERDSSAGLIGRHQHVLRVDHEARLVRA
jgi:hypothetical protein